MERFARTVFRFLGEKWISTRRRERQLPAGWPKETPVPNYFPIDIEQDIESLNGCLLGLDFQIDSFTADFDIVDDGRVLRVTFDKQCIVRILDEMLLSTECDETPNEGLVPHHFAYRVENATFWKTQSPVFADIYPTAKHYRFITGWACLDVISAARPRFTVARRRAQTDGFTR
jgi:hypothetical protein